MKKRSLLALVLLCNYAGAHEEQKEDSVEIKLVSTMRTDKQIAPDVLKEAQEDAKALTKKYEEVCGVKVSVEQSKGEISTEPCADCKTSKATNAELRCACNQPKVLETGDLCACELVQTKCTDCGKLVEDIRCVCGKPRPAQSAEEN